jgi:phospholipid/cholesterol/gamma-HCH transport system ATP-binding protein
MSDRQIVVDSITLIRDGFTVLNQASVTFPAGKTTIIMGPSGSGKTTLLKVAAGLFPADRGRVTFDGRDITAASGEQERELRRRVGFAFQDGALWQNMTIQQNLELPLQYHYPKMKRAEIDRRIERLVGAFPIRRQFLLRPSALSGGERKIVSFLRALVLEPEVLFFDEPTSFVDNQSADRIINILSEQRRRGCTLIGISHSADLTARLADFLMVIIDGTVREFGTTREVVKSSDKEVRVLLSQVLSDAATFDDDILDLLGQNDPFA